MIFDPISRAHDRVSKDQKYRHRTDGQYHLYYCEQLQIKVQQSRRTDKTIVSEVEQIENDENRIMQEFPAGGQDL